MDEKWSACARAGIATCIILHRERTKGNGKGKMIVGSGKPFSGQRMDCTVGSAKENAEPRESTEREEDMCSGSLL